jgi:hypothetical protein
LCGGGRVWCLLPARRAARKCFPLPDARGDTFARRRRQGNRCTGFGSTHSGGGVVQKSDLLLESSASRANQEMRAQRNPLAQCQAPVECI